MFYKIKIYLKCAFWMRKHRNLINKPVKFYFLFTLWLKALPATDLATLLKEELFNILDAFLATDLLVTLLLIIQYLKIISHITVRKYNSEVFCVLL